MSLLRFPLITFLLFAACVSAAPPADDAVTGSDGKADGAADVAFCKEVAGDYARQRYNDFEDVEILDTTVATVLSTGPGYLWIQTDSTGHGRESTDVILMASACYAIGSQSEIDDEHAAVFFARKAAAATRTYVEQNWDFDRILSAEPRWPITSDGVTVDVKVLDGGHDEGSFAVTLSASGKVKNIEETGSFTP